MSTLRIVVVGAGVVGLAVAYHLIKAGLINTDVPVTLIDRDPAGDKASLGNAGGIAVTEVIPASMPGTLWRAVGWMLDPLGPLAVRPTHATQLLPWLIRFAQSARPSEVDRISAALAALNARVYDDLIPMLTDIGLIADLQRHGALSLYETDEGYRRDAPEWARKRALGILVDELSGPQARERETALGPRVQRAVFTPQWSFLSNPARLVHRLREWLLRHGVQILTGEVRDITLDLLSPLSIELEGSRLAADRVVIAAGAWSGILARRLGDRVLLESERGYNLTLPHAGVTLHHQLIFAERKFVATALSCGLRIGGAAEFGGLNAAPNFKRSVALAEQARRYLPDLRVDHGTSWTGHRPATPDSLPVIGASPHRKNVFYAFGHGHLGLTQAATTGRLISEGIVGATPSLDLTPYAIDRFSR